MPTLLEKLILNHQKILIGAAIPIIVLTFFSFGFLGYCFIVGVKNGVVPVAATAIVFLMYFLTVFTLIGIFYQLWHYTKDEPLYKQLSQQPAPHQQADPKNASETLRLRESDL